MKCFRPLAAALLCVAFQASATTSAGTADAVVGTAARATATDPLLHRAFLADRRDGTVAVFDLVSGNAIGRFAAGPAPIAVLADAANSRLYVVNDGAPGSLTVVNAMNGDIEDTILVGDHPTALAADFPRSEVYVVNNSAGTLSIVDVDAGRVRATLTVGAAPNGIALDRVRGTLYVSNALDGTLTAIDPAQAAVLTTVNVGRNPGVPAVDERTGRVFLAALDDGTVAIYDPAQAGLVTTLPAGHGTTSGTWSPVYRKYFVANAADGTVTVVDADALRADTIAAAGQSPRAVAIDEGAGNIYVDNQVPAAVTLLDARDGRVKDVVAETVHKPKNAPAAATRLLLRADDDGVSPRLAFLATRPLIEDTAVAAEYYDADVDVYFHTSDATEQRLVDDGIYGADLRATSSFWRVWTAPAEDRVQVCRLFDFSGGPRTSHLYAAGAACDVLRTDASLAFERSVYYVTLPDARGACPGDTEPLYRLHDSAAQNVVRITPEHLMRDAMVARGWTAEDGGGTGVFACTPALGVSRLPAADGGRPQTPPRVAPIIPPRERPR